MPDELHYNVLQMSNDKIYDENSMKRAKRFFSMSTELLIKSEKHYPGLEHHVLFRILRNCMSIFINKRPIFLIFNDRVTESQNFP